MKNAELIGPFCQITVKMKTILPLAEYLSDGYWVITTIVNFRFSIDKLLRNSGHFNFNLWESFHENVPNYSMSNFATHFPNIEEIPMGHLIDKLKNLRQVENPENLPSWIYSIANLGIIIFIIVLVIICYVFLLCIMSCCFLLVLFM